MKTSTAFTVDSHGYYGKFGGAYIPEMLYPNIEELRENYLSIIYEEGFQKAIHDFEKGKAKEHDFRCYTCRGFNNWSDLGLYQ